MGNSTREALRLLLALLAVPGFDAAAITIANVSIDTSAVIATTSENFLGVNIDSASLWQGTKPHRLNFKDPGLQHLGKLFAKSGQHSILRVGGSAAENLGFGLDSGQVIACEPEYMDEIFDFVKESGFELVWDLNALKMRDSENAWNSTNAEEFLRYVAKSPSHTAALYALQLGNEPGHELSNDPSAPTPTQHGHDFFKLQQVVDTVFGSSSGRKPLLQGPDVCFGLGHYGPTGADKCANLSYFTDFLRATAPTGPESCILDQVGQHDSNCVLAVCYYQACYSPSNAQYSPSIVQYSPQVSAHHYGLAGPTAGTFGECNRSSFLTPTIWEAKVHGILQGWKDVQEKVGRIQVQ
jgi:hypothetical protein